MAAWYKHEIRREMLSIRRVIELPDGDCLTLHDDAFGMNWDTGSPVALLVHGMCGSAESPLIRRLSGKLQSQGIRPFRLNMRGCGDGRGLASHPYHAGRAEDIQCVIDEISQLCPMSPIYVVGFSLGGNIVLKWLGEYAACLNSAVTKALALCPPIDLQTCTNSIGDQFFGFYDRYFAKQLFRHVVTCPNLRGRVSWTKSSSPRQLLQFDEMFTAPQSGYRDARHYYESCSSAQYIPAITIPTLIMSAIDDPLIPVRIFEQLDRPHSVTLHLEKSGGHLGFLGRSSHDPDGWWLDWRIIDWLLSPTAQPQLIA